MKNYIYRVDVAKGIDQGTTCFELFDEAKAFAEECCAGEPKVYGVEVEFNDYGECVDHSEPELLYDPNCTPALVDDDPGKFCFCKKDITGGPCQEINELCLDAPEDPEAGKEGAAQAQIFLATGLCEDYSKDELAEISTLCKKLGIDSKEDLARLCGEGKTKRDPLTALRARARYVGKDKLQECKRSAADYDIDAMVEALGGEDEDEIEEVSDSAETKEVEIEEVSDNAKNKALSDLLIDEKEAIEGYNDTVDELNNELSAEEVETLKHISGEELEHIGELSELVAGEDEEKEIEEDFTGTPEDRTTHLEKIDKDEETIEYEGPANKAETKDIISKDAEIITIPEDEKKLQENCRNFENHEYNPNWKYIKADEAGTLEVANMGLDPENMPTDLCLDDEEIYYIVEELNEMNKELSECGVQEGAIDPRLAAEAENDYNSDKVELMVEPEWDELDWPDEEIPSEDEVPPEAEEPFVPSETDKAILNKNNAETLAGDPDFQDPMDIDFPDPTEEIDPDGTGKFEECMTEDISSGDIESKIRRALDSWAD